ncbi:MAG: aminoacetone oxidase family FAD-binding enzyme [Phycisphaera sp.]|nr:aminoacetone oxidase family FAD-binding enzyme [Phycisphaera sp.]
MTTEPEDIVIIGAGAAGLAAAVFAAEAAHGAERPLRIVVLDGATKIGAKILVSGGGRCNVTHTAVTPDDYNGPRNTVRNILAEFNEKRAVSWFASLGVGLKLEDTGKLFPTTDDAHSVLDALLFRCDALGVELRTAWRVTDVRRNDDTTLTIVADDGREITARRVVMATGGRSLPKTGSDGGGWTIVQRLGHTVTPTYPALVPLVLDEGFFHAALSGVAHPVDLSTFVDGKVVDRRTGALLWTHFGISGPVVMDASRFWVIAHAEGRRAELRCGFLPGAAFEVIDKQLVDAGRANVNVNVSVSRAIAKLTADLPTRVIDTLCAHVGVDGSGRLSQMSRDARRALVHALTGLPLPVERDRGWNYAEVTAGGVPLSEIERRTMASRLVPGLHLIGEMLDCEGRIGGFNFQWAWATGHVAGRAAVAALQQ